MISYNLGSRIGGPSMRACSYRFAFLGCSHAAWFLLRRLSNRAYLYCFALPSRSHTASLVRASAAPESCMLVLLCALTWISHTVVRASAAPASAAPNRVYLHSSATWV